MWQVTRFLNKVPLIMDSIEHPEQRSRIFLGKTERNSEHRFVSQISIVTMRDVARRAGVVPSTVSKALRGDPTISKSRRREIHKIAAQLGYNPNPMVASLMAQLHHRRRRTDPCQLAWIDLWPPDANRPALLELILKGVRARAKKLGYGVELYHSGEGGLTAKQLRRVLTAKGQWGFIIPPVPANAASFDLDVEGLAGIIIGSSLRHPALHRVCPNHFQGGLVAFRSMQKSGCKRIGLVLSPEMNDRVERKWLGAYLACQQELPHDQKVPPYLVTLDGFTFRDWCLQHYPDGLLITDLQVLPLFQSLPKAQHPALGLLMLQESVNNCPGVNYRFEHIGAVAADLVVGQIHRNERGCPAIPHTVEVDACWQDA